MTSITVGQIKTLQPTIAIHERTMDQLDPVPKVGESCSKRRRLVRSFQ